MDFNRPAKAIHLLTQSGSRVIRICAGILVCVCLLNCGCESEPVGSSDSQGRQPATSSDTSDSESADKKSADVASKKSEGKASEPAVPVVPAKPPEPDVNDAQFHAAIEAAAKQYLNFTIVNTDFADAVEAKLAPAACAPVSLTVVEEPAPRMSQADSDSKTGHGQKLYFLFAKDIVHYLNPDGSDSPVGQVLVKESWTAVPGNADARNLRGHASGNRVNPRVTVDGKTLKLGKRKELFVMLKQDPKAKATDEGWVYGVIDPESYEINSAGAVASCIACHEGEKDRLFRDGVIDWSVVPADSALDAGSNLPKKSADDSEVDE